MIEVPSAYYVIVMSAAIIAAFVASILVIADIVHALLAERQHRKDNQR